MRGDVNACLLLASFLVALTTGAAAAAGTSGRPWRHEEEFTRDASLHATPDDVVILHLGAAGSIAGPIVHTIPYRFTEVQTLTFCIPAQDPHIKELSLIPAGTGRRGSRIVQVAREDGCRTSTIPAGRYFLRVTHTGEGIDALGKKAFVHVPRTGRVLTEGQLPGSLPSSCDPDPTTLEVVSVVQAPNGRFLSVGVPFGGSPNDPCGVAAAPGSNPPLCAASSTAELISSSLSVLSICPDPSGYYMIGVVGLFDNQATYFGGPFDAQNGWLRWNATPPALFKFSDLGNSQFTMTANFSGTLYPVGVDSTTGALSYVGQSPAPFTNVATIYSTQVPPLAPGQVAVVVPLVPDALGACTDGFDPSVAVNSGWVFNTSVPDLRVLTTSPGSPISTLISCMRVGPQTIATLYTEPNYSGSTEVVGEETLSLNLAGNISSIKITPARQFIVATNACDSCNLSGVDLSGLTLNGGSFTGSVFAAANLLKTSFQGAALDHADFSGTNTVLSGTDFTGSTLHCAKFMAADLSGATFGTVKVGTQLTTDFSCRLDLTGASLNRESFDPSVWRYLNLSGATINGLTGAALSTQQNPLDLRGAILTGADLVGAQLDFADLGCVPGAQTSTGKSICTQVGRATLTTATLRQATLVSANLQGATLDYANLSGANLCGAQLNESPTTGTSASLLFAHLKNVNLAGADLSGATLSAANFYSDGPGSCVPEGCVLSAPCATATGATMNSTVFTGAYMNGVDMSGSATAQGADFSGALLVGVDFSDANLSNDPSTGTPTKFVGAFLQGADFTNANVANANFTNAYVTPEGRALMVFQLDASTHTAFAGYQAAAGSTPGCVLFSYDQGVTLPTTTDSTNSCPSGRPGPCSTTDWQSPAIPIAKAQPPSTSDGSLPAGCQQLDTNW